MTGTLPIVVITGPTASGKSQVAAALAREIGGEIISADSRQVYRYLDIGTNKSGKFEPSSGSWEINGVVQHLIDIVDPSVSFTAGEFVRQANLLITQLRSRWKRPIIAGGTGLYIKALIDGLAPLPEPDQQLRRQLLLESQTHGKEHLYQLLMTLDPAAAEKHRYNPQRLIRAIEVCTLSGKTLSALQENTIPSTEKFIKFGLRWPRAELYANINRRTQAMIRAGLSDEAAAVVKRGFAPGCPGLASTIGYAQALACADGKITRAQLEESISLDTRHYAKRQLTWFNRDKRIRWLGTTQATFDPEGLAKTIVDSGLIY